MKASRTVAWTGAFTLIFTGFLWAPTPVKADGIDSIQTVKLLADAKTMAVQLRDDAAKMQQFGQLEIKWQAHCGAVSKMREHVATMKEMVDELKAAEATAAPWEKAVIDRVSPYMAALATDNEGVIDEFDQHPSLFGTAAARAYLAANAESTTYLSALVKNVMENGTLRQTIQDYDEQEEGCGLTAAAHQGFGVVS